MANQYLEKTLFFLISFILLTPNAYAHGDIVGALLGFLILFIVYPLFLIGLFLFLAWIIKKLRKGEEKATKWQIVFFLFVILLDITTSFVKKGQSKSINTGSFWDFNDFVYYIFSHSALKIVYAIFFVYIIVYFIKFLINKSFRGFFTSHYFSSLVLIAFVMNSGHLYMESVTLILDKKYPDCYSEEISMIGIYSEDCSQYKKMIESGVCDSTNYDLTRSCVAYFISKFTKELNPKACELMKYYDVGGSMYGFERSMECYYYIGVKTKNTSLCPHAETWEKDCFYKISINSTELAIVMPKR